MTAAVTLDSVMAAWRRANEPEETPSSFVVAPFMYEYAREALSKGEAWLAIHGRQHFFDESHVCKCGKTRIQAREKWLRRRARRQRMARKKRRGWP